MPIDAYGGAGQDTGGDLIPRNQLAFVTITRANLRTSKSGNRYIDMEMVINPDQPYERRRLWHNLMDFTDSGHSETARTMAIAALSRILEVGRGARPDNPESYRINDWSDLVGMTAAVKIGIEKGGENYNDKNSVEFITGNPDSSTAKHFKALTSGQFNTSKPSGGAPAQGSFGDAVTAPAAPPPTTPAPQQQAASGGDPSGW